MSVVPSSIARGLLLVRRGARPPQDSLLRAARGGRTFSTTLPPPPPPNPTQKPASKGQKQAQFTAAVILAVGLGYFMLRKRNVKGSLTDPPEKSQSTRHMVPLRDRIDQDRLKAILAEEEAKEEEERKRKLEQR
jgi:hypothetical protein